MEENINALDELNKGSKMGVDAISMIVEKASNKKLKKVLDEQSKHYEKIMKKINKLYSEFDLNGTPHETNLMEKIMTFYGIEMKTMMDDSDSKIAELILKGTNMGIIEGRKIINNKNLDKKVNDVANEFVNLQESFIEKLKEYL